MKYCSKCGEIIRNGSCECPCGEGKNEAVNKGLDANKANTIANAYLSSGMRGGVEEGLSRMLGKEAKISSEVCIECSRKLLTSDDIFVGPETGGGHCYCINCYSSHFKKGDCKKCAKPVLGLGKEYVVNNNEFWHKECYEKDGKVCCVCSKIIFGAGVVALSKSYHQDCFNCFNCHEQITGPFLDWNSDPCCNGCYDKIKKNRPLLEENPVKSTSKSDFSNHNKAQQAPFKLNEKTSKIDLNNNTLKCDFCFEAIINIFGSPDTGIELSNGKTIHNRCFTCAECEKLITDGKFVTDGNKSNVNYHSECKQSITMLSAGLKLSCSGCRKPISGNYLKNDSDFYHNECFNCEQCRKNLSGIGYLEHPVTKKQICEKCHQDITPVKQVSSNKPIYKAGLKDVNSAGGNYLKDFSKDECPACAKQLFPMDNKTAGPFATVWHKSCLKCNKCQKQLDSAAKMKGVIPFCAMCFL